MEGTANTNNQNKRKRGDKSKDSNKTGDHNKKGKGNKWRNNKDGFPFKKQSKRDQTFAKQVLNVLKQQRENEETSYDSDHSTGWQRHCNNKQERVYVLGASQGDLDCSDSDLSITSTNAKKYLKRYRKQQKNKKKHQHKNQSNIQNKEKQKSHL